MREQAKRPISWQSFATQRGRVTSFFGGRVFRPPTRGEPMLKMPCLPLPRTVFGIILFYVLPLFAWFAPNIGATSGVCRPYRKFLELVNELVNVKTYPSSEKWKAMFREAYPPLEGFEPARVYRCQRGHHVFPALRGKDRNGMMCTLELHWGQSGLGIERGFPGVLNESIKAVHDIPFPERAGKDLITLLKSMESKGYTYDLVDFNCYHFTNEVLLLFRPLQRSGWSDQASE